MSAARKRPMKGDVGRCARAVVLLLRSARDGWTHQRRYARQFLGMAALNKAALAARQLDILKSILCHAHRSSPYYREAWNSIGFTPEGLRSGADLTQLPVLTKDIIERERDRLVSAAFQKNQLITSYTGGSSGTPTLFYRDRRCTSQRFGRQLGILRRCGFLIGDRCGLVWGAHQDLAGSRGDRGWKHRLLNLFRTREVLDCSVMRDELLEDFHQRLRYFRPKVLYGYPNALCHLARYLQERAGADIRVERIFCTAERLSEAQRAFLHSVFGGEVFNLYCTREHGCIGFECEQHRGLHIDAGSVYVEVVTDGRPARPGEVGELLVTDLLNFGMPFVRYRIGDRGALSPEPCPCGSGLPLLQCLEGRVSDLLYRSDGCTVAGVLLLDLCEDVPQVRNVQIIQRSLEELSFRIEPGEGYDANIERKIEREARKCLGDSMRITFEPVGKIDRNPNSGKFQDVICLMKPPTGSVPAGTHG